MRVLAGVAVLLAAALSPAFAYDSSGPAVIVFDQAIDGSRVVIAQVVSNGPGWLAVHTLVDGQPGPVIGYSPVRDGINENVAVSIDAAKATAGLIAMLHTDAGKAGVYEFPGADVPVKANGMIVMTAFQAGKAQAALTGGARMLQVADTQAVRIDLAARRFEFTPGVVRVKAGTPVELHIVSEDGTHGFAIQALGINEKLEKGREVVVRFTPAKAGTYAFFCSMFCGPGHRDMHGELIVE